MKHFQKNNGFTLVELLVSVGITAILMVGLSVFFSSTFRNMFSAREEATFSQGHFVVNTILNNKLANVEGVDASSGCGTDDCIVVKNDTNAGDLPFTYIGEDGDKLVMKDFFVFNGRAGSLESKNSNIPGGNEGGMTILNGKAYIVASLENKIYECDTNPSMDCDELALGGTLDTPIDITSNGTDVLYVTDAGNGRIVKISDLGNTNTITEIATGLNFPTGIAYYKPDTVEYLFVTEPYKNELLKVTINLGGTETVIGGGKDDTCNGTASFCQLNFPTGLALNVTGDILYIADTGSGRVLELKEPDTDPSNLELPINLASSTQISKVEFEFPIGSDVSAATHGTTDDELHRGLYSGTDETLTYSLITKYNTNMTGLTGCPLACTPDFRGFIFLDASDNYFNATDDDVGKYVEIDGTSYKITSLPIPDRVRVQPNPTIPSEPFPKSVRLTETFIGDFSFFVDITAASIPSGFQPVTITPYDESPTALASNTLMLRLADGELGTEEDVISILSYDTYPTGVNENGEVSATADYDLPLASADFTSEFDVQILNSDATLNGGSVLEFSYKAMLKEDDLSDPEIPTPVWETYTFNAPLGP